MSFQGLFYSKQILRFIQSVPGKKADPFKLWLAKAGSERIDEAVDHEQPIERTIQKYRGRKALTDEWDKSGLLQGDNEQNVERHCYPRIQTV
ncbi:MAG: hypothetical protein FWG30_08775 [Eubacteriaceae bacterium]|nr:hypothetical protein [Eubacteriaceae bacterium]